MKLLSSLLLAACLLIASCGKDDPAPIEVGSVELSETLLVLAVGDQHTLRANVLPEHAEDKTVVWRSGDKTVVDVSEAGLVTALSVGTATVTATAGGKSATCAVTVEPISVESVEIDPAELTILRGGSQTLTATVQPDDATDKAVTWRSSDKKIASVDESGRVEALAIGTATVTATAGGKSATCTVTVLPIEVESIELDKPLLTFKRGESEQLKATVLPDDADDRIVTWQSSAPEVATVSEEGLVEAVDPGTATITATAGGKSAMCTVKVEPDVYVVGYSGSDLLQSKGILWKNGVAAELPCSQANSVFVHEGDVYVSGQVNRQGASPRTVWFKNGSQMGGEGDGNYGQSIFVRNGAVYMAGGQEGATIWKDGVMNYLEPNRGGTANDVYVTEQGDVYVAGSVDGNTHEIACYWKNGERHLLSTDFYDASASSIVVKDNVVYVCGNENPLRRTEAVLWIDGEGSKLEEGYLAREICIAENNDVYVVGLSSGLKAPTLWENGVPTDLSQRGYVTYSIPSICLYGEELYMAGSGINETFVWKDGVKTVLPGDDCQVMSIFVY